MFIALSSLNFIRSVRSEMYEPQAHGAPLER